jgi:hypothetical protein
MVRTIEHIAETHRIARARRDAGERVWQYTVTTVRPLAGILVDTREARFRELRDRFAAALKSSSWFRESTKDDGEDSELWALWDEIKDAETDDHFNAVLAMIYDLADVERCWLEFV